MNSNENERWSGLIAFPRLLLGLSISFAACAGPAAGADTSSAGTKAGSNAGGKTNSTSAIPTSGIRKPARTVLNASHETNIITVKFRDGLNVRMRGNQLVSTNA